MFEKAKSLQPVCCRDRSKSLDSYNVAIGALQEATKRVALVTKNEGRTMMVNRRIRGNPAHNASRANTSSHKMLNQPLSEVRISVHIDVCSKPYH